MILICLYIILQNLTQIAFTKFQKSLAYCNNDNVPENYTKNMVSNSEIPSIVTTKATEFTPEH